MGTNTKEALAHALMELMQKKALEKITVSDISSACGLNRQTFYYYYHDIYDVLEWIYQSKGVKLFLKKDDASSWQEGLLDMFTAMKENRAFVTQTYHSRARDNLEQILQNGAFRLISRILRSMDFTEDSDEEHIAFIAGFYKYAFAGSVLDWIGRDMQDDPETIVRKTECLMTGMASEAMKRLRTAV